MIKLLLPLLFLTCLSAQELFDTFELGGKNKFIGKSTYEFDVSGTKGPERAMDIQVFGDINIEGEVTNSVTIIEKITIKASSKMKAKSLFKANKAKVTKSGSAHIEVISDKHLRPSRSRFEYDITLPEEFNVSVHTTGGDVDLNYLSGELLANTSGGDISAFSINGKFTGRTSGGDIVVKNIEGLTVVKTSGGDIEIERCDGKTNATTSGGDIEISECNGDLDIYTSGGDLNLSDIRGLRIQGRTSGGDIEANDVEGNLIISTSGGTIDIRNVSGSLDAKTSGGDIDLESIYGKVDIATSSGDITGNKIRGAIYAKTSHGDIKVSKIWDRELNNHDLYLKTSQGMIRLELPDDFPAVIDAVIENETSTGAIDSEFPISIFIQRDEVRGEGTVNGGTYNVKLRTSSNSIIIEKN